MTYNQNKSNDEYEMFTNTYMEHMVQLTWEVQQKGCHGYIFCSELKFGLWYKQFRQVTEKVEESGMRGMWQL